MACGHYQPPSDHRGHVQRSRECRAVAASRALSLRSPGFLVLIRKSNRHRLARSLRLASAFQDLDLAINAQNLRHLLLKFIIATFQIVPHLVRFRRLASRPCNGRQRSNLFFAHRQLDRPRPSCHGAAPRSMKPKQGIHEQITSSMPASFMESVV